MTDRQLLRAVKTAADRRRRNRAADDERLNTAMRDAEAVGVPRKEVAEASGLAYPSLSRRIGPRRRRRPDPAP